MAKLEKERIISVDCIVLHILYNTKGIVICIPLFNHEIAGFGGLFISIFSIHKRQQIYFATSILK